MKCYRYFYFVIIFGQELEVSRNHVVQSKEENGSQDLKKKKQPKTQNS